MQKFKIAIVGEAWGQQEDVYKRPFVGAAGDELTRLLGDAGILTGPKDKWFRERGEKVFLTNVFNFRPKDNDIEDVCCKRKDLPAGYSHPPLKTNLYVRSEFLGELDRLRDELVAVNPNIVIALGNTACWALLGRTRIDHLRGAITKSSLVPGLKVLPTYHPSFLLHGRWDRRPITVMDLSKAREESESAEISRIPRELWLDPTLDDLVEFERRYIVNASCIAFDIENPKDEADGAISCVSIASDFSHAIVVPFFDKRKPVYNYWPTLAEETAAWLWLKRILEGPIPKVGQNGLYDIQHLMDAKIMVNNYRDDTMILHHSLQPEEKKGLGVLGSLYSNEEAWKAIYKHSNKTTKKDD